MRGASVRWSVARRMFVAWLVTVPAAAIVGAGFYGLGHLASSYAVLGLLVLVSGGIMAWARVRPVNHLNVNDDWQGEVESTITKPLSGHDPSLLDAVPPSHGSER